jgi:hypothetical protein
VAKGFTGKGTAVMSEIKTIEQRFRHYLKLVGLKPHKMSKVQYQELRRAFYGAAGHMLVFMKEVGGIATEDEMMKVMNKTEQEVMDFWSKEKNKHFLMNFNLN